MALWGFRSRLIVAVMPFIVYSVQPCKSLRRVVLKNGHYRFRRPSYSAIDLWD